MNTNGKATPAFSVGANTKSNSIEKLLTPREAAEALSVSERTLWGLAKRGEIAVVRLGRATRYDPEDVRELIASRKRSIPEKLET